MGSAANPEFPPRLIAAEAPYMALLPWCERRNAARCRVARPVLFNLVALAGFGWIVLRRRLGRCGLRPLEKGVPKITRRRWEAEARGKAFPLQKTLGRL
jgi:hypothetical protein